MKIKDLLGLNPPNPKNNQHSGYFKKRKLIKIGISPEIFLNYPIDPKVLRTLKPQTPSPGGFV